MNKLTFENLVPCVVFMLLTYIVQYLAIIDSTAEDCIHLFSCIKCQNELYYNCVTNKFISSFCQLLFIQYSVCEHISVSHFSVNVDALTVGCGFQ